MSEVSIVTIWWNYFDVRLHFYDFYCVLLYFFYLFCLYACLYVFVCLRKLMGHVAWFK